MNKIFLTSIKMKNVQQPVLIAFDSAIALSTHCDHNADNIDGYSVQIVTFKSYTDVITEAPKQQDTE